MARDLAVVFKEFESSPPSFASAERFVLQLRAVDRRYAPAEVKQAVKDYADALDNGLQHMAKTGNSTVTHDEAVASAKQHMVEVFQEYD